MLALVLAQVFASSTAYCYTIWTWGKHEDRPPTRMLSGLDPELPPAFESANSPPLANSRHTRVTGPVSKSR